MTSSNSAPRAEDLFSVGARISWGAILGGSFVALAIYFMLAILGAAVGLSVSDRVNQTTIQTAAVVWGIVTLSAALFVGGLITSLFTVGENKVEAVFYGVIMWAFLLTLFLFLAATGVRAGASGMVGLSGVAQAASAPGWQATARDAGVPQDLIEEWRRKAAANADSAARKLDDPQTQKEILAAATRLSWFAFGGTWISMIAAALGALIGAGPTFRVVVANGQSRVITPASVQTTA